MNSRNTPPQPDYDKKILHLDPAGGRSCTLCGKDLSGKLEFGEFWLAGGVEAYRRIEVWGFSLCNPPHRESMASQAA